MNVKPFAMIGQQEALGSFAPGSQHLASYSTLARAQAALPKIHPGWVRVWVNCPDGSRVKLR